MMITKHIRVVRKPSYKIDFKKVKKVFFITRYFE